MHNANGRAYGEDGAAVETFSPLSNRALELTNAGDFGSGGLAGAIVVKRSQLNAMSLDSNILRMSYRFVAFLLVLTSAVVSTFSACGPAATPAIPTDSIASRTLTAARAVVEPFARNAGAGGSRAWLITVQDAPSTAVWSNVIAQLRLQLSLVDTSSADSLRTMVTIRPGRFVADTFVARISVGGWVRCPRVPSGVSETTFEVRSIRQAGAWGAPVARELSESVAILCPATALLRDHLAPLSNQALELTQGISEAAGSLALARRDIC